MTYLSEVTTAVDSYYNKTDDTANDEGREVGDKSGFYYLAFGLTQYA